MKGSQGKSEGQNNKYSDEDLQAADSKVLAAHIVGYRLLKLNKNLSIKCMEELNRRKINGDDFDFNSYIEEELKKSPKPNLNDQDKNVLFSILKNFKI